MLLGQASDLITVSIPTGDPTFDEYGVSTIPDPTTKTVRGIVHPVSVDRDEEDVGRRLVGEVLIYLPPDTIDTGKLRLSDVKLTHGTTTYEAVEIEDWSGDSFKGLGLRHQLVRAYLPEQTRE